MTLKQSQTSSVEPIMGYKTSDGKMYATHKEALLEQHLLEMRKEIDCFSGKYSSPWGSKHAILDWERYKKQQELNNES
jgi:hypothetical protein